jgi:anthranilate/para-aminobenzoate synthase component I
VKPVIGRAGLIGTAWRRWRGSWSANRALIGHHGGWCLVDASGVLARWSDIGRALRDLWHARTTEEAGTPWAVGWLGFEACAAFGGDLPIRADSRADPRAVLLLEPSRDDGKPILGPGHCAGPGDERGSLDDAAFADRVADVRQAIAAGEVYQVNVCRRFTWAWEGGLASLAKAIPSPAPDYLAALSWEWPSHGELLCASMERLVRLDGDRVTTGPIKGSRARGATAAEDAAAVEELDRDPKELAELAMIVDLERNDLGRVAQTGSVRVVDPGSVRTYAAIHHRVAEVAARVRSDVAWWEVLAAVAPGGSVTGCPKHAAMAMIRDLEPVARGPFTGALGVIGGVGDLELALPIRTAWSWNRRLDIGAGCGVVWDSEPWSEVRESRLKVAPWLRVLGGAT